MKQKRAAVLLALTLGLVPNLWQDDQPREGAVESRIIKGPEGDMVLAQEFVVEAPVSEVWKAHTTVEGWTSWSAPLAEIDFRAGGTIKTHYGEGAKIGDPGTIVLHIVNYVPERVLTLRAELSDRWPEVMKEDEGKLMSVLVFEPLTKDRTRVSCYGVGYRDLPEYDNLMKFFLPANEGLFRKLQEVLKR